MASRRSARRPAGVREVSGSGLSLRRRSIRSTVTLVVVLLVGFLLGAGCLAVLWRETARAELRAREILSSAQAHAVNEMKEWDNRGFSLLEVAIARHVDIGSENVTLTVYDERGAMIWASAQPVVPLKRVGSWRSTQYRLDRYTLVMGLPWWEHQADLHETAVMLALLCALVMVGMAFVVWVAVGRILYPLESLAHQSEVTSAEGLSVSLVSPSSDSEMLRLTRTLNSLLGRIAQEAQSRRRFYAAASHELRTPLQALLGRLELAVSRERSAAEYRESLLQCQHEAERLSSLVQDLLQLHALESKARLPEKAPTDLGDLSERLLFSCRALAVARDLKVKVDLPELEVDLPPMHAEMVVRNLIENSHKYARQGGVVHVFVSGTPKGSVTLQVYNECDLAEDVDPAAWLEPFARPDKARNSTAGGNGLGLAIAQAVAVANSWDLQLTREADGITARCTFAEGADRVPILTQ